MLKWSVLVYALALMVALHHLYSTHRRMLTELQSVKSDNNFHCYCCCNSGTSVSLACGSSRGKRDVSSQRKPRAKRQTEQRTFLHLVPVSIYSSDERDTTVLSWAVGRSQGAGLQVSGESIAVVTEGLYFIYSQVLYKDSTWVMGHMIIKRLQGAETKLMKCLKSMPSNVSMPLNTCYTAGVHFLESGSVLELSIPRTSAGLVISAQTTFMGIFSI